MPSTSPQIHEWYVPTRGADLARIVAGPDGAMWVTERAANKILRLEMGVLFRETEYAIPTSGSQPWGIAVGPDGAIWFTENAGNKIGRLQ